MLNNNAINPKTDGSSSLGAVLMPSRSGKVKSVKVRDRKDGIGGATNIRTGEVFVPTGNNAEERTIRFHEAMHASHTSKKARFADLLDQALEDARLHRYASKSAESQFQRARRDEVCTALRELRSVRRASALNSTLSLTALRAMAILLAGPKPVHVRLLDAVLSRFGEHAAREFREAISILRESNGDTTDSVWGLARKRIQKYFATDFRSERPAPSPVPSEGPKDESKGGKSSASPEEESEPDESNSDSDPEDSDKSPEGDSNEDADSMESESDTDTDTESDSKSESESSLDMAPAVTPPKKTRQKASDADEYTMDLTPAADKENYDRLQGRFPLKLYIRRLDMGINRVKLSLGRRTPMPVSSGQKILANKLASAFTTPGTRVFARTISQGGQGTILIDASGSMCIPTETLIQFLQKAPALTLAFYNAPDDNHVKHPYGNIFIYAANGYRAAVESIDSRDIPHYGSGNLIDYHAICWLLKQPRPHYIVTDQRWTGPFRHACPILCRRLVDAKELIIVKDLQVMERILQDKNGQTHTSHVAL